MSDETLAGLHSSLIKKKVQTSDVKVIAITEGTLPNILMIRMNASSMMGSVWELWRLRNCCSLLKMVFNGKL
jgi:hypothetical protein